MIQKDANTSRLLLAHLLLEKASERTPQDMCDLAVMAMEVRGEGKRERRKGGR